MLVNILWEVGKVYSSINSTTVKHLYNGHIGAGRLVRYKEVSFIGRLVQECICNPYYMS